MKKPGGADPAFLVFKRAEGLKQFFQVFLMKPERV